MKKYTLLFVAIVCAVIISCKGKKETNTPAESPKMYSELEKAKWLLGSWGNPSPQGNLTENWEKVNDSVYKGASYFVVGADTVFSECIRLEEANGKLAYIVSVKGQNSEKPVRFELTTSTGSQLVFENPKHDFPNKIVYNKITNDSLVAEISGIQNGKPAAEQFKMKRLK